MELLNGGMLRLLTSAAFADELRKYSVVCQGGHEHFHTEVDFIHWSLAGSF